MQRSGCAWPISGSRIGALAETPSLRPLRQDGDGTPAQHPAPRPTRVRQKKARERAAPAVEEPAEEEDLASAMAASWAKVMSKAEHSS